MYRLRSWYLKLPLLYQKILTTLLILFVFVVGRNIPLPLIDMETYLAQQRQQMGNDFLQIALNVTGGSLERASLLTLGIGPYMSTMLIWRFVSMGEWYQKLKIPMTKENRYRNIMTLIVSLIQGLAIVGNFPLLTGDGFFLSSEWIARSAMLLSLIAGSFFLIWLVNQNVAYGLGQQMIIIMANMLITFPKTVRALRLFWEGPATKDEKYLIVGVTLFTFLIIFNTLLSFRAEERIPINRVMINHDFAEKSYLPLNLNPGGGMAIMYAMTLFMLPNYVLMVIKIIWPHAASWADPLMAVFQMNTILGTVLYLLLIFSLSLGFAFINVDPKRLAKQLRQSGDYISGVNPGRQTELFLRERVLRLSTFGAMTMILSVGIPSMIRLRNPDYTQLINMPITLLILVSIMLGLIDQIEAYWHKGRYRPIFDDIRR